MTAATELRAKLVALLNEMAGEAVTSDQIAYRLQCGKASAKHTAESLVTSGAARQRKNEEGQPGYHIPNAEQMAEELGRHALRCQFRPLTPRKQYNEAVARALAERTAIPSIG